MYWETLNRLFVLFNTSRGWCVALTTGLYLGGLSGVYMFLSGYVHAAAVVKTGDGSIDNPEQVYKEIPSIRYDRPFGEAVDPAGRPGVPTLSKRYLGIYVNDSKDEIIAEFIEEDEGRFLITPKELKEIGLVPSAEALVENGLIDISNLPHVLFDYDDQKQTVRFHTSDHSALMPTEINLLQGRRFIGRQSLLESRVAGDEPAVQSHFGALVNYTVYADSGSENFSDIWTFQGVSGQLEGRVFGRWGTVSSNQIVRFASGDYQDTVRLDTYWSYWDPERLHSYTAGDFITRSLPWTRSVRMGGFQWRRNFAIRSDLVTMPLPSFSGSAAVPSSIDIYINNLRRSSSELPAGPYVITNFPLVSGSNEARIVVKDALGREIVTEMPFYASIDMLGKGLMDFSLEGGFVRYDYGTRSNEYSGDFATSGTVRYGFTDFLTLEGHGEYASGFVGIGTGVVFNTGSLGVMSLSGAASHYHDENGLQFGVGYEMEYNNVRFNMRSQRALSKYNDLASVTVRNAQYHFVDVKRVDDVHYDNRYLNSNRPIKSLDQFSVSLPLQFDPTTLNVSFTQSEYYDARKTRLLSLSASRSFGERIFGYATAYMDMRHSNAYGIFAGLSIGFKNNVQVASSVISDRHGTYFQNEVYKYATQEIGTSGWRLRDVEGSRTQRSAYGTYRSRVGRIAGSVEQNRDNYRVTAELEGAVVVAGRGVFVTNRIDDSFVVVDVGTPGVLVSRENRPYGLTGWDGKLIVPDLVSYQPTKLAIDPSNLPFNSIATSTRVEVMPAYRTGVVARFAVEHTNRSALIAVVDANDNPIELGSLIQNRAGEEKAMVGYDGQTLLQLDGVKLPALFLVKRTQGGLCQIIIPSSLPLGILNGVTPIQCASLRE